MESNAFKTGAEESLSDAVAFLCTLVGGLIAVFSAIVVNAIGPAVIVLTWTFCGAGLVLALASARTRSVGIGLLVAGAALPCATAVWLWVVVSVEVLTESVAWF